MRSYLCLRHWNKTHTWQKSLILCFFWVFCLLFENIIFLLSCLKSFYCCNVIFNFFPLILILWLNQGDKQSFCKSMDIKGPCYWLRVVRNTYLKPMIAGFWLRYIVQDLLAILHLIFVFFFSNCLLVVLLQNLKSFITHDIHTNVKIEVTGSHDSSHFQWVLACRQYWIWASEQTEVQ